MTKKPNGMRHLDDAIRRSCGGAAQDYMRLRTRMANAIVAQMLPDGVVKGGSSIKMRYGDAATRFTTDLDMATAMDADLNMERLNDRLRQGWEGFTGRVVRKDPASPKDVPEEYVMQPCEVKLSYLGKPWCTVPLEVGFNEIGDADTIEWSDMPDVAELFEGIGFPPPGKAPLMPLDHQVTQKLHAVSGAGDRARRLATHHAQVGSRPCRDAKDLRAALLLQKGSGMASDRVEESWLGRALRRAGIRPSRSR